MRAFDRAALLFQVHYQNELSKVREAVENLPLEPVEGGARISRQKLAPLELEPLTLSLCLGNRSVVRE